jgi:hypothetical protein
MVYRRLDHQSGQTNEYEIPMRCIVAKHTALMRMRKETVGLLYSSLVFSPLTKGFNYFS